MTTMSDDTDALGSPAVIKTYLTEAASWDADRAQAQARAAKRAWIVAGVAVAMAISMLGVLAVLLPLKEVRPYLLRVDSTTGVVDTVTPFAGVTAQSTDAVLRERLARYLLQQYVVARERYVAALAEQDYQWVGALQSAPLNQRWAAHWDRANPESPINRYQDGSTVRVQVKAISFLPSGGVIAGDLAQVRYTTALRPAGTGAEKLTQWVATLRFQWLTPPTEDRQRALNPLGIRIVEWQAEPEWSPEDSGAVVAGARS